MTGVIADLLGGAERSGLEQLGGADLQQRVDRKYLAPAWALEELADELCATHSLLEVDGRTGFRYRSAYLDTPDLGCFHAHRQGRRLRWKARTRLYRDSDLCRFEVKLKTGRGDTDKHALTIDPAEFGTLPEDGGDLLRGLLADRYGQQAPRVLVPTLTVDHRRSTLVSLAGDGRLTIDSDLRFRGPRGTAGRMRPSTVLLETKSADGRSLADLLLREAGIRPVSVSKYCVGVALTHRGEEQQPWRPLLRRSFTRRAA